MKTLKLLFPFIGNVRTILTTILTVLAAVLLWQCLPTLLRVLNPTVGLMDSGVWQLLLLSIISFITMLFISIMLFNWLLGKMGLFTINTMVLQFKALTSWQQLKLYWVSFALLFLGALLSLTAIF